MKTMRLTTLLKGVLLAGVCLMCGACESDDECKGYVLSGRWFGDLGMMVDGNPAIGSDISFIPDEGWSYSQGWGVETDYYEVSYRRVMTVEHRFNWSVNNGVIYLRFDDPSLDCNIRDYSLSPDWFEGYLDGVYSSVRFNLRSYDKYWSCYGYYTDYTTYMGVMLRGNEATDTLSVAKGSEVRRVNIPLQ